MKVPIMGGEAIRVNIKRGAFLAISPDNIWIASTHWEPANINTAIYPFKGGAPGKLLDFVSYYFRWTPDGHSLAYVNDENASAIIDQPIDGRPPNNWPTLSLIESSLLPGHGTVNNWQSHEAH